MNLLIFLSVVIFLVLLSFCEMHKILIVSHLPIKSHAVLNHVLVKLLLNAGHKITQITLMPINKFHPNLRQIDVSYNKNYFRDKKITLYEETSKKIFTSTLQHEDVQILLNDTKQQFDLVIAEWMYNDIGIGLAALYDCPLIWFSALETCWSILQQIEESVSRYSSSIIPRNTYPYSIANIMHETYLNSIDKDAFIKIFGPLMALRGKSLPPYTEILYLRSMVFVYSPVLLGDASTWPQNFKPIGGYHISPKVKPLPENLQRTMDNAKHDVIYFSLGSHLQSEKLPVELKEELLEMFSKLKKTVIWKHESSFFTNLPSNVHVTKWVPQQSILSHPNCALFITQGGILSMTEAVYYAVPVLGIPIFGDQFVNVQRAVDDGIAKQVLPSPTMMKEMENAIKEILQNSSYRRRVKEHSSIYHDRRMPPRVEVVYWVNHVIRKGVKKIESTSHMASYINIVMIVVTVAVALKYLLR